MEGCPFMPNVDFMEGTMSNGPIKLSNILFCIIL